METSAQTITRPSFAAVNAPQNALASPSIPAAANLVTKVSTEECAGTSPRPSPDADSDVLEDIPPKPPTQDDMAVDLSDTEDLITVYTGELRPCRTLVASTSADTTNSEYRRQCC